MPKPKKGEKRISILSRCMGDKEMNSKFPDKSQRYAVCNSYWDNKDKVDEKFVCESLEDILKPKRTSNILNEVKPFIDEMLDKITHRIFDIEILETNDFDIKKINENGEIKYLTTKNELDEIITNFISDGNVTYGGEYVYRFPELFKYLYFITEGGDEHLKNKFFELLRNAFINKFNIEC